MWDFFILFRSWVINKSVKNECIETRSFFKFLQIAQDLNKINRITTINILKIHWKVTIILTHSFPMHPFSTPWKTCGFLMFSGGRERLHWERANGLKAHFQLSNNFWQLKALSKWWKMLFISHPKSSFCS